MASILASNLFSVKDMVFVITGGGSGLGEMMALVLAANGAAKVFILGRRLSSLEQVAAKASKGNIIPVTCDVSSKDSLAEAVAVIEKQTPFVSVVIANSGIAGPSTAVTPFKGGVPSSVADYQEQLWETKPEENNAVSTVNVIGTFYTFVAFLKLLDAGNKHEKSVGSKGYVQSQFITLSSIAGFSNKVIMGFPYAASKAALIRLTENFATEFAPYGIRVNSIAPGLYITEATEFLIPGGDTTVPGTIPLSINPALRTGNIEDIGGIILFLTSRAGAFVNGSVYLQDGGGLLTKD